MFDLTLSKSDVLDVSERLRLPLDDAPDGIGVIGSAAQAYLFAKGLAVLVQVEVGGVFTEIMDALMVGRVAEIDPDGGANLLTWWPGITVV